MGEHHHDGAPNEQKKLNEMTIIRAITGNAQEIRSILMQNGCSATDAGSRLSDIMQNMLAARVGAVLTNDNAVLALARTLQGIKRARPEDAEIAALTAQMEGTPGTDVFAAKAPKTGVRSISEFEKILSGTGLTLDVALKQKLKTECGIE